MARIGAMTRAAVGDLVDVSGRRVGDPGRTGEIVEVLGTREHPHYLVRWDDAHTTMLYPGEGTTIRSGSGRTRQETPPAKPKDAVEELVELLRDAEIAFEVLSHRRTLTAASEARALGVLPQTVAKTVIARDEDDKLIRAVIPATGRLALTKLAEAIGARRVQLLSEGDLAAAYPQFELGAVPPFGGPTGDRVVVDRTLVDTDHVILEAGVHETSLRLRTEDLIAITTALVANIGA